MKLRKIFPKKVEGRCSMCLTDGTPYEAVSSRVSSSVLGALETLVEERRFASRSRAIEQLLIDGLQREGFIVSSVSEDRSTRGDR